MKMVTSKTIRKNVARYAAMAQLSVIRNYDDSYTIRDNVIGYNVFQNVDKDWVVRTIYDSLYMKRSMETRSLA
jgi:hypothetical protein